MNKEKPNTKKSADLSKTAEQLLKENELLNAKIGKLKEDYKHYKFITENTTDNITIITFDLKAKYLYVSPSIKQVLDYEPEDLLGKSFFDFIHPDDKKVLLSLMKQYVDSKVKKLFTRKESSISETIEFRFKNKAGVWRNMHSTVNIAGKNLLAVTRDITERKHAEEKQQRSESLLKITEHLSKIGGWRFTIKGQAMYRTDEAYHIHEIDLKQENIDAEKQINDSVLCYDKKDRSLVMEAFQKCINEGISYDLKFPFTTKKGNRKWIRTIGRAEIENNKVVSVIGNIIEITERKNTEKLLKQR